MALLSVRIRAPSKIGSQNRYVGGRSHPTDPVGIRGSVCRIGTYQASWNRAKRFTGLSALIIVLRSAWRTDLDSLSIMFIS